MFTEKEIQGQLKSAGILPEDTVLLHTSMRAIGEVENGADGLIDIFRSYLNRGLLLVPTHTWGTVCFKQPVFDSRTEKPCIGILPVRAAVHPDGVRSLNPTHSLVAFGDKAEEYIRGEETICTPTPENGCWGRLADVNAKILLIGVGLERNTFIHAIDEMAQMPNRLSEEEIAFTDIDRNGNKIPHPMRVIDTHGLGDISVFFPKFEPLLREEKALSYGKIGNAKTIICDAKRTKEILVPLFVRAGEQGIDLCRDSAPLEQLFDK